MDHALAAELEAMWRLDQEVRAELAAVGSLFQGYHPRMAEVHQANARRLEAIIEACGWPTPSLVGESGARAAFGILNHAIGDPALQRRCLGLLDQAARRGEAPLAEVAALSDRIAFFEGRPQRYGTQLDWDARGVLRHWRIEHAGHVNRRRAAVGLPPLPLPTFWRGIEQPQEPAPADPVARLEEFEAWARSVGWRL